MPDPNPSERLAEIEARVEDPLLANVVRYMQAFIGRDDAIVLDANSGEILLSALRQAREDIPWLLEQVREAREAVLRDVLWLIDCEIDAAETNGPLLDDVATAENIKRRIRGHFHLPEDLTDSHRSGGGAKEDSEALADSGEAG